MKKIQPILQNKTAGCLVAWMLTLALITSLMTGMGCIRPKTAQAAGDSQVILHNPTYDSGVHEVTQGAVSAAGNIHNPVYNADTDETTWDCVWFGNYKQSGVADKDDKEPIKWRVLSVDGDDVFLLADKSLNVKPYNETDTDITWETCTLRSWLNGYGNGQNRDGIDYTSKNFIDAAFTMEEQAAIQTTDVVNGDNPYRGTEGGNNTKDKIFLLSIAEVSNPVYGFQREFDENTDTRRAMSTTYVAEKINGYGIPNHVTESWWLRSPGITGSSAATVDPGGYGYDNYAVNNDHYFAIRPALHLTLSSSTLLTYAGTVSSTWGGSATWDCVYFGNYWQSDTNGDGVADEKDAKEPIKWRVLSVDGDDVFLLADKNLDVQPYNETYFTVTWESCTLRSWLNGYGSSQNTEGIDYMSNNFLDAAFTKAEQTAIQTTDVVNGNNPCYATAGGSDTKDKIFLLSIGEASSEIYGFHGIYQTESDTRMALNTMYVAGHRGMNSVGKANYWWLRSPGWYTWDTGGRYSKHAVTVSCNGKGNYTGSCVDTGDCAIRPALHLTLSSSTPLTYAGIVCSDGTVTDTGGNVEAKPTAEPTATAGPTAKPTAEPTVKPAAKPTVKPTAKPTIKPTTPPASGMPTNRPQATQAPAGPTTQTSPAPGQVIKDTSSKAFYQIVSTGTANATVSYLRPENKMKKEKVPDTISYCGKKYKVTSIAKKAFAGNKRLKTVIIGKNVKIIEKNAFQNCKALQKITVKSNVLTKVGKNALKGTNKRLTIKVPKKKKAKYKKLFKGKGNKKLQVK